MRVSIIIPVFNEEKTIGEVIETVSQVNLGNSIQKEIIIVDDGSTDRTLEEIKKKSRLIDKILALKGNKGKGEAVKSGLKKAEGDIIIIQDADLEYFPDEYPRLIQPILENEYHAVLGSRFLRKTNSKKNLFYYGNKFTTALFNFLFKTKFTDIATAYKVFTKDITQHIIKLKYNDFRLDVVGIPYILSKYHIKTKEVPIRYSPRPWRKKKLRVKHGVKIINAILVLYFKNLFSKPPKRGEGQL